MIVRILGEGQLHVDDSALGELNQLDAKLEAAVEHRDQAEFEAALGRPVQPDQGDRHPGQAGRAASPRR